MIPYSMIPYPLPHQFLYAGLDGFILRIPLKELSEMLSGEGTFDEIPVEAL